MKRNSTVAHRRIVQAISSHSLIERLESRWLMSTSWQSVQIGGGGFVTGLAASTTGSAIYARTDVGGAYRWNGTSSQWMPITQSLPNDSSNSGPLSGIESVAVDPANANRVFIAAGSYTYSMPSGIYVTTDSSVANPTWTNIDSTIRVNGNGGTRNLGERLVVDPNNSNVVYYGTNNVSGGGSGLRKYVYNGTSWAASTITTPAIGDVNLGITFVAADASGGTVVVGGVTVSKYLYMGAYSGTAGSGGVFASSDGGQTWTKVTGLAVDKPSRGEVATDGTLYVTFNGTFASNGGVAKLVRGATAFTSIAPVANLVYVGLAVDPNAAGTVMVSETGSDRMWRTTDGGTTWVLMNRTLHATDLDGTPSVTRPGGGLQNTADILITPGNASEVWASDFLGVVRTDNIKNDTTASDWYNLQKNMEEVVPLALTSAPSGAPLLTGEADVNGFVHNSPDVRPQPVDKFESPGYISTTGLDFSEATSGANTVWARVGDLFYTQYNDSDRTGGISIDDGKTWAALGQLDSKSITNATTDGWETFDVGAYLAAQKAAGATSVTLVVRASTGTSPNTQLTFSSREGANPPQAVVNGSTVINPTADATVSSAATTTNYGNATTLAAKNYYYQSNSFRYAFLKFDLTSLSTISSATLRLYRLAATDTNTFSANVWASADTSWVEGNGGTDNTPANEITWTNMPALDAPPSGATGGRVALSATDPGKIVWAAENGAVWYSRDRGVTWTRSTLSGSSFSLNTSTEFVPNQMNLASDRVAADTFYGYSTTGGGTVYRSTDGGATWSALVTGTGTGVQYKIEAVPGQSGQFWLMTQNYNVGASFKVWNGTSLTSVSGISSVVDFTFGKAAPGLTNPTVFVRKADGNYWYSVDATAGSTSTWTLMSAGPITNQTLEMEGDRQSFGRLYVGTGGHGVFYADVANNATWDGGPSGTGTSWNTGANWNPDALPLTYGTATFTNSGLTAGEVVTLDANQTVNQLTIGATTGFTIGSGTTYGLSLQNVDRQDVAGTEANQTLAAPITLTGNGVWSVAGSGVLATTGGIAGAYTLAKQGTGELDLGANTYTGDTSVLAGTLKPTAAGAIKGNLIVGGGSSAAVFSGGAQSDAINNSKNVTVNANGAVTLGNGENITSLTVNGGTFNTTYSYVNGSITMTGGTIGGTGAVYGNHTSITTNASASTAYFNTGNSLYGFGASTYTVADGAAVVDLKVNGGLAGGSSGNNLNKTGAGLMMLTAANAQASGTFAISNGTVLVNNTSGSGTGQSAVSVNATAANATLGGTGTIGGVSGYTNANVSLAGNSTYTANLTPGTVDESTGAHVLGTLTVGSATQANNVTLNGYSQLNVTVNGAANDRLTVNGNLTINAANTTLAITIAGTPTATSYTLASCTGTLSGTFANVTGVPSGYQLVYGTNSITLVQSSSLAAKASKSQRAVVASQTTSSQSTSDSLKKHKITFSTVQITTASL